MTAPAYNDPAHRAAVAALKRAPARCYLCPRLAETIDHVPPLALHEHRRGAQCCRLEPACRAHNLGAGASVARARRRRHRPRASRVW